MSALLSPPLSFCAAATAVIWVKDPTEDSQGNHALGAASCGGHLELGEGGQATVFRGKWKGIDVAIILITPRGEIVHVSKGWESVCGILEARAIGQDLVGLLQKEPLAAVQSMELEPGGRDKKQVSISGVPGVVVKIRRV